MLGYLVFGLLIVFIVFEIIVVFEIPVNKIFSKKDPNQQIELKNLKKKNSKNNITVKDLFTEPKQEKEEIKPQAVVSDHACRMFIKFLKSQEEIREKIENCDITVLNILQ